MCLLVRCGLDHRGRLLLFFFSCTKETVPIIRKQYTQIRALVWAYIHCICYSVRASSSAWPLDLGNVRIGAALREFCSIWLSMPFARISLKSFAISCLPKSFHTVPMYCERDTYLDVEAIASSSSVSGRRRLREPSSSDIAVVEPVRERRLISI